MPLANQSPTGSRTKKGTQSSIFISILVHIIILIVAGNIIALIYQPKPEALMIGEPPPRPRANPRKLEMKVRVQQLQKRSARPQLAPRMVSMNPSDIAIPELKKPSESDKPIKRMASNMAVGVGQGIGGGFGTGLGGGAGASFFGLQSTGRRIAYIIDYSASMRGSREQTMREELSRSIEGLMPGTEVFVVMFSGPAWIIGEDSNKIRNKWSKQGSIYVKKKNVKFQKPDWLGVSVLSKNALKEQVEYTDLTLGTNWLPPFQMVFELDPRPDAIYFMTDGRPQSKNEEQVLKAVRDWNKKNKGTVPVNAIAIGEPGVEKYMKLIAQESGGHFTVVDTKKFDGANKKMAKKKKK
ncbi:MAG: hypothetical protein ACI9TH_003315 [Kiritimatiellia bacterium]|jgi:hypothetical protein